MMYRNIVKVDFSNNNVILYQRRAVLNKNLKVETYIAKMKSLKFNLLNITLSENTHNNTAGNFLIDKNAYDYELSNIDNCIYIYIKTNKSNWVPDTIHTDTLKKGINKNAEKEALLDKQIFLCIHENILYSSIADKKKVIALLENILKNTKIDIEKQNRSMTDFLADVDTISRTKIALRDLDMLHENFSADILSKDVFNKGEIEYTLQIKVISQANPIVNKVKQFITNVKDKNLSKSIYIKGADAQNKMNKVFNDNFLYKHVEIMADTDSNNMYDPIDVINRLKNKIGNVY